MIFWVLVLSAIPVAATPSRPLARKLTPNPGSDYDWNLSISPLDFAEPSLRLDLRVADHWSLGIATTYLNAYVSDVTAFEWEGGFYLTYSFGNASDNTWYLDFGAFYGDMFGSTQNASNVTFSTRAPNITGRILVGYQWSFGRPNLSFAVGGESNSAGGTAITDTSGNVLGHLPYAFRALIELSLGVAF